MSAFSTSKIAFIDRDGTLIEEPADFQIDRIEKFRMLPNVIPALQALRDHGYRLVMVTNQDGLGSSRYPQAHFDLIQGLLVSILKSQGIQFESILICPHFPDDRCLCRKPQLGLLGQYLSDPTWSRPNSIVIGDRASDEELSKNLGVGFQKVLQDSDEWNWDRAIQKLILKPRQASIQRNTKETAISASVDLDSPVVSDITTGVGFFDHMLDQLSRHGGFSLILNARGDLHIDEHHLVEDVAITIGTALRQALGDKIGIGRYGFFLPMDESVSEVELDFNLKVGIDLSGRSSFNFDGKLDRPEIGGFATEMIPHFFRSLSDAMGATLRIQVRGENTHHQIESMFKAVGRSIRQAIQKTRETGVPSTKGVL